MKRLVLILSIVLSQAAFSETFKCYEKIGGIVQDLYVKKFELRGSAKNLTLWAPSDSGEVVKLGRIRKKVIGSGEATSVCFKNRATLNFCWYGDIVEVVDTEHGRLIVMGGKWQREEEKEFYCDQDIMDIM